MHGCVSGFTFLVNTEVDSMGGIVDCGVVLDTKASPHRASIAKTQEELRLEYDVREERRRELEFLEKGGNPLDYKFGRAISISVQSTSLRDQRAEQFLLSEAKGSFALAASPHGDSVESSGRPAGSLGREPNIADNLLLFAGENSSPGREKITKRTGRRSNASPAEHSSKADGFINSKDRNDLVIFNLGPRGQAYARRNRSRSSRDSHNNRSQLLLSSGTDDRGVRESHNEVHTEEHTLSSIMNSKPTSPNAKRVQKGFASKNQLDLDNDIGPTRHSQIETEKSGLKEADITTSKRLKDVEHNSISIEQTVNSSALQTSDLIGKDSNASDGFIFIPSCAMDSIKGSKDDQDKNHRAADVDVMDMQQDNVTGKENVSNIITEALDRTNIAKNPFSSSTAHLHESADGNDLLTFRIDDSFDINSKDHAACPVPSGAILALENRPITNASANITSNSEARTSQAKFNNAVQVKDESHFFEEAEEVSFSSIEIRTTKKSNISQDDDMHAMKAGTIKASSIGHNPEPSSAALSKKVCSTAAELQNSEANQFRMAKKAHEDAILREARMIEATSKWAALPSVSCISSEKRKKLHWDFVLEEMAWMANDFMQERLWKTTAAAQVCHHIASVGRSKFVQENFCQKQKDAARILAKAVMSFWSSVSAALIKGETTSGMKEDFDSNLFKAPSSMKHQNVENGGQLLKPGIQTYALRLLQYLFDTSSAPILAEAPRTPDRIKDAGSLGVFWDDQHSEESLFYTVLPGAMRSYRDSVESFSAHLKVEECEASNCDSLTDGPRRIALEEDESETGADILPGGFQGNFSTKFVHKKKKGCQPMLYSRRYEVGTDLSYQPYLEGKSANHSVAIMGERPSGIFNAISVPTKRVRTAARQRIISPFTAGSTEGQPMTSKTDVSSGDTTSFQDDHSSRYGCLLLQKNLEIDSTADFQRFLPFDSSDLPMKPKKKKKSKHFGYKNSLNRPDSKVLIVSGNASSYEQRLQADYMVQQDQRDYAKKRGESLQFEFNGNSGFYGQNVSKKPKLLKRSDSPEPFTPVCGTIPSPVASQMSNMSNSNKLIKIISNRDRGRKSKALKMTAGQSGPGMTWSTFEDQALVVLVHDMGLNWELVSDAFNSTLQFKCIYRKPMECKERHKFLMDKSAGDGADSAEDSGSSQPYPSTLPGIPKGSARQLFQRLQGPMEEDTMKSHFEKIILIWQRLHPCRNQDNKQQLKPITPAHSSHAFALSQACPNNLSGPLLSPLDLCVAANSNSDAVGLGYHGSHTNGIVIPGHQGSLTPVSPTSSTNTLPQGTPSIVLGSSLPTPALAVHGPPRDAQRYGVPRPPTLPIDDQNRLQQYTQNLSGRNMQQSGITMTGALSAGVDRGVRMLAGGNGMGMMCGVNRSISMPRTSFQGVSPTGMLNMVPNNMLSSNGVGISNPMGAHSSAVSSPGNTMLRPREALQMLRPVQTTEEHRQIMMQEIQLQVSQGNAQAISPFSGMSTPFSNAPVPPTVQTVSVQQLQTHQITPQPHIHGNHNNSLIQGTNHSSSQQHAYIRFAKEGQLQQRIITQNQHPYSSSSSMSPLQNNSQFQQQTQSTSPVNSIASSQPHHKHQPLIRNPQTSSSMSSQIMKQRQRQQVQQQQQPQQQQPRNLQQSKQQVHQQAKHIKGLGRGSLLMHQNLPVDSAQVGVRPAGPANQASEKFVAQQALGFNHATSALNSNLQQSSIQQKLYPRAHLPQSKQLSTMPSHSDTNQASIQATSSPAIRSSHQSVPATPTSSQQRQANQSQTNMRRIMLSQKRQSNHDSRIQSINEPVQMDQITPSTSLTKTTDSCSMSGIVSSGVQWKQDPSFETCSTSDKAQSAALPLERFSGNDEVIPPSTHGLLQRQLSGNVSIHGHAVGGQWQQHQQLQSTPLSQQQHRQGVQGNLCMRSSNSGS